MKEDYNNTIRASDYCLPLYFDLQAKIGHTKHLGGLSATRRLAEMCHLGVGKIILNVGSGAGISAAYVAENFGCRVFGVDLLPGMKLSAERWAESCGLAEQMDFRIGDAQDLPFENSYFDAIICESVNVFVPDKAKAVSEYLRVVKPGGYIGLNEAIWVMEPTEEIAEIIVEATGQQFLPSDFWENLLHDAGLLDLVFEHHAMNIRQEARNQFGLIDFWSYLQVLGRAIGVLITDRETRPLIKYMSSNPRRYFEYMGYGLYAGRKPQ